MSCNFSSHTRYDGCKMSWKFRIVLTVLVSLLLNYLVLGLYARAVLVSLFLLLLWWKNRGVRVSSATTSYGRSREAITHVAGERKACKIYPFCPSIIDFHRKFEDELTVFLHLLGTRFAQPRLHRLDESVNFESEKDGGERYSLDLCWLLRHFADNASKYALLLTSTASHQKDLKKLNGKIEYFGLAELMANLKNWQDSIHIDTIASLANFLHTRCTSLSMRLSGRMLNVYLTNLAEGGSTSEECRTMTLEFMQDGLMLAEIICMLTKSRVSLFLREIYIYIYTVVEENFAIKICFVDEPYQQKLNMQNIFYIEYI